jgi:hypothetical protein
LLSILPLSQLEEASEKSKGQAEEEAKKAKEAREEAEVARSAKDGEMMSQLNRLQDKLVGVEAVFAEKMVKAQQAMETRCALAPRIYLFSFLL